MKNIYGQHLDHHYSGVLGIDRVRAAKKMEVYDNIGSLGRPKWGIRGAVGKNYVSIYWHIPRWIARIIERRRNGKRSND